MQVSDVNEIFRDLAIMVGEQGNMLDDIESGLVETADQAEQGLSLSLSLSLPLSFAQH